MKIKRFNSSIIIEVKWLNTDASGWILEQDPQGELLMKYSSTCNVLLEKYHQLIAYTWLNLYKAKRKF